MYGRRIVVGAWGEDGSAHGVNGGDSLNGSSLSGAAYTYELEGRRWKFDSYLKASNSGPDDLFGASVAIWEDRIVIGAPRRTGAPVESAGTNPTTAP